MGPVLGVVTDIEGTTTPIAFVRDTLFPFARDRLAGFLAARGADAAVAAELAATAAAAPGREPLATLLAWLDADVKATPLKTLQGLVWREGYAKGDLRGVLYPDVAPALRAWSAAGIGLVVYSSGSEEAQRLLFAHAEDGDLAGLFAGFYDTRVGAKREPESYDRIAIGIGIPAAALLFLSDAEAELDAARAAGLRTCQLVREADGTVASGRHSVCTTFTEVGQTFGLCLNH